VEAGANKRIVIVDDHPLIRFAFTQLIEKESNLTCAGQADSADSGIEIVKELKPDLVVLDLGLGDGDGFKVMDALRKQVEGMRILIVSRHTDPLLAERALHAGAMGFISKEEDPDIFIGAIRAVLDGKKYVGPILADRVARRMMENQAEGRKGGLDSLSTRELQIFRLLGEGKNNKGIAGELGVSSKTVDAHRENIKHKLGIGDSISLIKHAVSWVESEGR
jgi:DNA-binding NarL/FixJ family response regulator